MTTNFQSDQLHIKIGAYGFKLFNQQVYLFIIVCPFIKWLYYEILIEFKSRFQSTNEHNAKIYSRDNERVFYCLKDHKLFLNSIVADLLCVLFTIIVIASYLERMQNAFSLFSHSSGRWSFCFILNDFMARFLLKLKLKILAIHACK